MGVALATTAVSGSSCFFVAVAASAATAMDADAAMTAVSGSSCFSFADLKRTLPIGFSYGQGKRRRSISLRLLSFILM